MGLARIVVGVDGSEGSHRALEWAVQEAAQWGAALTVVHAWRFGRSPTDPNVAEAVREIGRAAQHVVDHEVAFARAAGVDASGVLAFEGAVHALVAASAEADLLVVGSRGRGAVAASLLGSVSQGCVRHARSAVVVVPGGETVAARRDEQLSLALDR
jgi:nucleotide-binding universal stress UspA family protein